MNQFRSAARILAWATATCGMSILTVDIATAADGSSELFVDIEFPGVMEPAVTRCIIFELWQADCSSGVPIEVELLFTNGSFSGTVGVIQAKLNRSGPKRHEVDER